MSSGAAVQRLLSTSPPMRKLVRFHTWQSLDGAGMRRAVLLGLAGALLIGACTASPGPGSASSAPSAGLAGETIVIRTEMTIADTPGSEPTATGKVLEGSMLAGATFCVDGTIRDSHANLDPAVEPLGLIDRTFTCPDGTVRMVFTPAEMEHDARAGTWTIVSGTGAFEKARGTGSIDTEYDPANQALPRETLTGTITR
jgi:hypothetical protein